MIVGDEVGGRVTVDFFQVPARDVFRVIMESTKLRCVVTGNVLRVTTAGQAKAEEDERARAVEARTRLEAETRAKIVEAQQKEEEFRQIQARGPVRERTIRLFYADAGEVAATILGILGLPPEGAAPPAQPLPGAFIPPIPTQIPATPPPPPTVPTPAPTPSAETLSKGLTVRAYKPTNSIFIRYYENDLNRIEKLIRESLDIPLPQIQIAAQMVITTKSALEQLGIQWGGAFLGQPRHPGRGPALVGSGFATGNPPTIGTGAVGGTGTINPNFTGAGLLPVDPGTGFPTGGNLVNLPTAFLPTLAGANPAFGAMLGIIGSDFNVNLAIQALEVQGKARRLSEPKVVTVENAKAVISRGFEVPFVSTPTQGVQSVQFKEALLQLTVTPNVIRENDQTRIRMKLIFENNEPDFSRADLGNPSIFKRKNETEVVIKEGEKLVVGGIQLETRNNAVRQVPLLGDIPVLGWLFKAREISLDAEELLVILTPTVVSQPGKTAAR
jgi:type IV pilus assembly protein PilQ